VPIQKAHPLVYGPLLLYSCSHKIFVTMLYHYNTYLSVLSLFNKEDFTILSFTNKMVHLLPRSLQFI